MAKAAVTVDEGEIIRVRDEFLSKSRNLYLTFYVMLALSTFFSGVAQLLVYEEKHFEDVAGRLDLAAMTLTFASTICLQVLALSGIKSIAASLNRVGRLLNVYLFPFISVNEKKEIVAKVIELTMEMEPFWVTLPKFKDGKEFTRGLGITKEHKRIESLMHGNGDPIV